MSYSPSKPWFAPKRYGYGAGLPLTWQGWLVLVLFIAAIAVAVAELRGLERVLAILAAIAALVVITAAKTAGGWRWRSGGRS